MVKRMLAMYLIDLQGTTSERAVRIKEYSETLKKECEKSKCKFLGQYGAVNDRAHFMILLEAGSLAELMKPFMDTKRPEWLWHIEWKFYG